MFILLNMLVNKNHIVSFHLIYNFLKYSIHICQLLDYYPFPQGTAGGWGGQIFLVHYQEGKARKWIGYSLSRKCWGKCLGFTTYLCPNPWGLCQFCLVYQASLRDGGLYSATCGMNVLRIGAASMVVWIGLEEDGIKCIGCGYLWFWWFGCGWLDWFAFPPAGGRSRYKCWFVGIRLFSGPTREHVAAVSALSQVLGQ